MQALQTELEGKKVYFGEVHGVFKQHGYDLGGNWDYDHGVFDSLLSHGEEGETIYIRVPFKVIDGQLDDRDALVEFETPYILNHVVEVGLDKEERSLLTASGFNQFQEPVDKDGEINSSRHWEENALRSVETVMEAIPRFV